MPQISHRIYIYIYWKEDYDEARIPAVNVTNINHAESNSAQVTVFLFSSPTTLQGNPPDLWLMDAQPDSEAPGNEWRAETNMLWAFGQWPLLCRSLWQTPACFLSLQKSLPGALDPYLCLPWAHFTTNLNFRELRLFFIPKAMLLEVCKETHTHIR